MEEEQHSDLSDLETLDITITKWQISQQLDLALEVCSVCGDTTRTSGKRPNGKMFQKEVFCDSCFSHHVGMCENCQIEMLKEDICQIEMLKADMTNVHIRRQGYALICISCLEQFFYKCGICNLHIRGDDFYEVEGTLVCPTCFENVTFSCHSCETYYFLEDARTCSLCHVNVCAGCLPTHEEECIDGNEDEDDEDDNEEERDPVQWQHDCIHHHNWKPLYYNFLQTANESRHMMQTGRAPLYLGIELEVDGGRNTKQLIDALLDVDDQNLIFTADGSLTDVGFEIKNHPATLAYHREHFNWDKITNLCREQGYKSHSTDNCGLHIHVNKNFLGDSNKIIDLHVLKLLYLYDKFVDELVTFNRRDYNTYCKSVLCFAKPKLKQTYIEGYKHHTDRYMAVNVTPWATIEFRAFRGTLKTSTIYACLEWVDGLVRYIKNHSIQQIAKIETFAELLEKVLAQDKYPALRVYAEGKNLIPPRQPAQVQPEVRREAASCA